MQNRFWLWWEDPSTGVSETIGYYRSYKAASNAFRDAISENKHLHYHMEDTRGCNNLDYDPNEY